MPRSTGSPKSVPIYQLKVTLQQIRPPIWRRIQVPGNTLLPSLHSILLAAMGWSGGHLHAFRVGQISYGKLDPEFDDGWTVDERRVRISQIAPAEKSRFHYDYDFGDDWDHLIVVEKILPPEAGKSYPICLAGKRACPPEDCGGPWGYAELLDAISDPEHEEHEELLEWIGGEFDPEEFDLDGINGRLQHRALPHGLI